MRYFAMSSIDMAKEPSERIGLLQGTLDMLILRTLLFGPAHGHQIAKHIQNTTDDLLQIEHGSLYPALHRLERKKWIKAEWKVSEYNQRVKTYQLTAEGKKRLAAEHSKWKRLTAAMAGILNPPEGA